MGCLSKNYKKIINLGSWESNSSNDKFHFLYQGCYIVLALFIECSASRFFFTVHDKRHDFKFSSVYILVHFFFLSRHGIFVSVIFWRLLQFLIFCYFYGYSVWFLHKSNVRLFHTFIYLCYFISQFIYFYTTFVSKVFQGRRVVVTEYAPVSVIITEVLSYVASITINQSNLPIKRFPHQTDSSFNGFLIKLFPY
jgi:hypothetical protein